MLAIAPAACTDANSGDIAESQEYEAGHDPQAASQATTHAIAGESPESELAATAYEPATPLLDDDEPLAYPDMGSDDESASEGPGGTLAAAGSAEETKQ
jgi:hypothetical protein